MAEAANKAVVLVSGGLDSATCLAMAKAMGYRPYALSVDYGQRHRAELRAAERIAVALEAVEYKTVNLELTAIGGSALTDQGIPVPHKASEGIPVTYVPARNTILLGLALAWAEVIVASDIFIGVNAVDYSGYPDCRPAFIAAFEQIATLGTRAGVEGRRFRIHTPLIELTKAAIIQEGLRLGVDFSLTVSCYQADEAGRACGSCDACRLRRSGFEAAEMSDPTRYR
jgi:7-cyano-7-deazaguanine synthase